MPIRIVLVGCLLPLMSGCLLNSAYRIHSRAQIPPAHSLVVIGMRLDANWTYDRLDMELDEYSLSRHKITGNCFHFTRIKASLPSPSSGTKYFAYLVPAGAYIYGLFNAVQADTRFADRTTTVFKAPVGETVYFGDFVYDGTVMKLHGDIAAAQQAVNSVLPRGQKLIQATTMTDAIGPAFLCTP